MFATANMNFGFFIYCRSVAKNVSAANSWESVYWNLPSGGFAWLSLDSPGILIDGTGASTGEIYIDNISFSDKAVP